MTTTKSYSNEKSAGTSRFWPMYKSALKAQMPFAIISGIAFFVALIVPFFAWMSDRPMAGMTATEHYQSVFWLGVYFDASQNAFVMVLLAFLAVASAMTAYSFMHNKKTVDLYHSLPVTRPELLGANTFAGFTAILAPFTAVYLLTMLIQTVLVGKYFNFGFSYVAYALLDLACIYVYIAVVFLFIAAIAVNVGTMLDTFTVSATIGFTPVFIYIISGMIWGNLTYGANFMPSEHLVLCLSPFMFMFERFVLTTQSLEITNYLGATVRHDLPDYPATIILIFCGIIAAALLYVIAAVRYRRRGSEIAEQSRPGGVLQTIVKLMAVFCGAALFFGIFDGSESIMGRIVPMLLGSVAIGVIAEIILARGVRTIKRNVKWLAGAAAVYCALTLMLSFDVFGYEKRLPALENVQSIKISNVYSRFENLSSWQSYGGEYRTANLTLPESLAIAREFHSMAIEHKPPKRWSGDEYSWQNIELVYTLKNGSTMRRKYNEVYSPAYALLANLEDKDDYIKDRSAIFRMDKFGSQSETVDYVEIYANIDNAQGNRKVFLDDYGPLVEAIKADMLNQSLEDIQSPKEPALGFINVKYKDLYQKIDRFYYEREMIAAAEIVIITREYKNTLAELERQGLMGNLDSRLDEVRFVGFVPVRHMRYDNQNISVSSLLPWISYGYSAQAAIEREQNKSYSGEALYIWEEGEYFSTSGRADIEAVAKAGMSQLLPSAVPGEWLRDYALACFVFGEESVTWKVVKISDLPAGIAANVQREADADIGRWESQPEITLTPRVVARHSGEITRIE